MSEEMYFVCAGRLAFISTDEIHFRVLQRGPPIKFFCGTDYIFKGNYTERKVLYASPLIYKSSYKPVYTGGPCLKFLKVMYSGIHSRFTVPMGPFLCLAMITSARFLTSLSLL